MTEDEYPELLRHVSSKLAEIGRPDIDAFAFAAVELAERPSDAVLGYLAAVLTQVRLESRETIGQATERLNASLVAMDGGFVEEIVLLPSEQERRVLRRETISLRETLPARHEFIRELHELYNELLRDRNERRP